MRATRTSIARGVANTRRLGLALMVWAAVLAAGHVHAQSFPSRPLTIVAPFPADGPNDILARALAEQLALQLKRPVTVENKVGATGNIGAYAVVRAAPDGHTLLLTLDTSITANPELYGSRMGFDAERDLRPVSTLARFSQMLVAHPGTQIASFKRFVDKARNGELTYVSAGIASPGHLTMEALQSMIGGKLAHIPYRGNAPAVLDLLGGQGDLGFVATPSVARHVASGRLIGLAVSGGKRSPLAPKVPTLGELGYPQGTADFAHVLLVPAATPDAVVARLNAEVRKALASSTVASMLKDMDIEPVGSTTQQATADLAAGRARWSKVVKERDIQVD